jgi:uncharacterized protein YjbI with pentapeptide repeats
MRISPLPARPAMLLLAGAIAAFATGLPSGPAAAACTEPAAPGVSWRRCYQDGRDLIAVDLTGAELRDASFTRSTLTDAKLGQIDGFRAKFFSANLSRAVLDDARLIEADFTRADLTGASLKGADLRNAKLVGADMRGANLTGAKLEGADLRNAELESALWVDGRKICAEGSVGQCH